jgi:hypothetical protein
VGRYSLDLSFPVSYREQQRYLELADHFLALDERHPRGSNVTPIDSRRPSRLQKTA